jgi:hypothetical protein
LAGQTPNVYANAGFAAANSVDLTDLAVAVGGRAVAGAIAIARSGHFAASIKIGTSKFHGVTHWHVYSTDPGAMSIEWDHINSRTGEMQRGHGVFTAALNGV